jgi:endonuclease/exonuclease/phosphatase family metal-dependent hydrolase
VHFFDRFYLNVLPFTPTFFRNVSGLDAGRRAQFEALRANLAADPHPALVSGNFNAPPGDGDLHWLNGLTDASRASHSLYPATFSFFGPALWRVDWTFTSPHLRVNSYALLSPQGLSTHNPQDVLISLPGQ